MYVIKNQHVVIAESLLVIGEKALIANDDIEKDTIIFLYEDTATDERTRTSIQVSENKHIEPGDFGAFANHSCEPNCQVVAQYDSKTNRAKVLMLTIQAVKKGEELTFDYATTETTVTPALLNKTCCCGTSHCRKRITGFSELTREEKMTLLAKEMTASYMQTTEL